MKQEQMLKKKDSKEKRVEEQQIFTSKAASGVLTNDLLAIMKDSKKLVLHIHFSRFIFHLILHFKMFMTVSFSTI
jgi:hypothetical protein